MLTFNISALGLLHKQHIRFNNFIGIVYAYYNIYYIMLYLSILSKNKRKVFKTIMQLYNVRNSSCNTRIRFINKI